MRYIILAVMGVQLQYNFVLLLPDLHHLQFLNWPKMVSDRIINNLLEDGHQNQTLSVHN